jgi:hypothetical protein
MCMAFTLLTFVWGVHAGASVQPILFNYEDNSITARGENVSLLELLHRISQSASIDIYVLDTIPEYITVDFSRKSLEDVLRALLRGCNYAVAYYGENRDQSTVYLGQNFEPAHKQHLAAKLHHTPAGTRTKKGNPLGGRSETTVAFAPRKASRELPGAGRDILGQPESETPYTSASLDSLTKNQRSHVHGQSGASAGPYSENNSSYVGSGGVVTETVHLAQGSSEQTTTNASVDNATTDPEDEHVPSPTASTEPLPGESRQDFYERMIAMLEDRIASGLSDQHYEFWSQKKDPRFVRDDRMYLHYYRARLEKIQQQ